MIKYLIRIIVITGILPCIYAHTNENLTKEELKIIIQSLNWKESGTYSLPRVFSTLTLPKGHQALVGNDAQYFVSLCGGSSGLSVEAVTINKITGTTVVIGSIANGYTPLKDIEKISQSERLNIFREQMKKTFPGESTLVEWYREPVLDRQANTLSFSYEVQAGRQKIIMSTIIKYYRYGQLCFVSEIEKSKIDPFNNEIQRIVNAHKFEPGHRYIDYVH